MEYESPAIETREARRERGHANRPVSSISPVTVVPVTGAVEIPESSSPLASTVS